MQKDRGFARCSSGADGTIEGSAQIDAVSRSSGVKRFNMVMGRPSICTKTQTHRKTMRYTVMRE